MGSVPACVLRGGMVIPSCISRQLEGIHPGWPRCLDLASVDELDSNVKYSLTKTTIWTVRTIKT